MSGRPSKQWRTPAGVAADPNDALGLGASYAAGDPLARIITDRDVFFATVAHAAELAGVDREHLATALRLGAVPGEIATARRIHDAAAALSRAGFCSGPPPSPRGPDAAALASDLASLGSRGAGRRGRKRGGQPGPRSHMRFGRRAA
jgi:hypothetical protein